METRTIAFTVAGGCAVLALTLGQVLSATPAPPPSASAAAARSASARGVAAEGRVVTYPGAEVRIAAEWGGRVTSVGASEGTTVKKGALLLEVDASELRANLGQARARVAEAEADIRLAEANRTRFRALASEGVVAPRDLDAAERDVENAQARRLTAASEAERVLAQIKKTRVVSPLTGAVLARDVDPGESVTAGQPVLTIADLSRLRIEAEADEADAASLKLGAAVTIRSDAYPGKSWRGKVEEVGDSATVRRLKPQDPGRPTDTRILTVKVAFTEATPLKLGTTVDLRIAER